MTRYGIAKIVNFGLAKLGRKLGIDLPSSKGSSPWGEIIKVG